MKRTLIIITLAIIFFFDLHSQQITKREKVMGSLTGGISLIKTFENDSLVLEYFLWHEKNAKYSHITDMIRIFSGEKEDFYNFLSGAIDFYKTSKKGTDTYIQGIYVLKEKYFGVNHLSIYSKKRGYANITLRKLQKIKARIEQYL